MQDRAGRLWKWVGERVDRLWERGEREGSGGRGRGHRHPGGLLTLENQDFCEVEGQPQI